MEERTGDAFELGEKLAVVGRKLPPGGRRWYGQSKGGLSSPLTTKTALNSVPV